MELGPGLGAVSFWGETDAVLPAAADPMYMRAVCLHWRSCGPVLPAAGAGAHRPVPQRWARLSQSGGGGACFAVAQQEWAAPCGEALRAIAVECGAHWGAER